MKAYLLRTLGVLLLVGMALGAKTTSAQTSSATAIKTLNGQIIGSASASVLAGGMNVSVTLQGASSLASYTICVSSPYPGAIYGQCPFGLSGGYSAFGTVSAGCIAFSFYGCGSTGQVAVVYTDANGNGQAVIPVTGIMPTAVVTVSNNNNPSDVAQATLSVTGGSGTPCFGFC